MDVVWKPQYESRGLLQHWRAATIAVIVAFVWVGWTAFLYRREFIIAAWPIERSGFPFGRDFCNLAAAVQAALAGELGPGYGPGEHRVGLGRIAGLNESRMVLSYPPTALWLALPFATMPLVWAMAGWLCLSVLAFGLAVGRAARAWIGPFLVFVTAFLPASLVALQYGQTSYLLAACVGSGFLLRDRNPVVAGALLAVLVVKPQLGLLLPAALLALGSWRAVVMTAVFAGLYVAVTTVAFGLDPWLQFIQITLPQQRDILFDPNFRPQLYIGPFHLVRTLGASVWQALVVQGVAILTVISVLWRALPRIADDDVRLLVLMLGIMMSTAYLQMYELPLVLLPLLRLAVRFEGLDKGVQAMLPRLGVLLIVGPMVTMGLALDHQINLTVLVHAYALHALVTGRVGRDNSGRDLTGAGIRL